MNLAKYISLIGKRCDLDSVRLTALKKKKIIYRVGNVYLTNVDRLGKQITPVLKRKQLKTIARAYAALAELNSSNLAD